MPDCDELLDEDEEAAKESDKDKAALLLWSLRAWHKKRNYDEGGSRRKLRRLQSKVRNASESCDLSESDEPWYGSVLLTQIKECSQETNSFREYMSKSALILVNTIFMTFVLGMLMVLPVGMISIGPVSPLRKAGRRGRQSRSVDSHHVVTVHGRPTERLPRRLVRLRQLLGAVHLAAELPPVARRSQPVVQQNGLPVRLCPADALLRSGGHCRRHAPSARALPGRLETKVALMECLRSGGNYKDSAGFTYTLKFKKLQPRREVS